MDDARGRERIVGVRCVRTRDHVELVVHSITEGGRELITRTQVGASAVVSVDAYVIRDGGLDAVTSQTLDLAPEQMAPDLRLADVLDLCDRLGRAA
jgi:hypothetical protein